MCLLQKWFCIACGSQCLGAHGANAIAGDSLQALAKPLQCMECSLHCIRRDVIFLIETAAEANHLFDSIDDLQLAILALRNNHMEAVGAEIDGGNGFGLIHLCLLSTVVVSILPAVGRQSSTISILIRDELNARRSEKILRSNFGDQQ